MESGMKINGNISDLFFNTDLEDTKKKDAHGNFNGFDEEKLNEEASSFLASLQWLGVEVPSCEDLIADFYARL